MAYRFKHRERVEDGLRRIAREQMDRAIAELTDSESETAAAIHQVRKRLKKLRGLLRIVRPALGEQTYKEHNRNFRDLGRTLADVRDSRVMLRTLEELRERIATCADPVDLAGAHRALLAERERLTAGPAQDPEARTTTVRDALRIARRRVDEWSLEADDYAALGRGLKRGYSRGGRTLAMALNTPSDERFHEWRKRVKDHWYHARLLKNIWPAPMQAYAGEMKRLSDLLGDEHDLAVLRQWLEKLPSEALSESERGTVRRFIFRRQNDLREDALRLGRRVYVEKPKRFRQRMGACWQVWRREA